MTQKQIDEIKRRRILSVDLPRRHKKIEQLAEEKLSELLKVCDHKLADGNDATVDMFLFRECSICGADDQ